LPSCFEILLDAKVEDKPNMILRWT
jgi:hypothetical protein